MNGEKRQAQRDYQRGYNRACKTALDRISQVLAIARAWRSRAMSGAPPSTCKDCRRWTRGGSQTLWGFCAGKFEWQVGEPMMWADAEDPNYRGKVRIVTREEFSCINWTPKP